MKTGTSERSHTALLRSLLPSSTPGSSKGDAIQSATVPGQNGWEVYGVAFFVFVFQLCWTVDLVGSVWLGLPLGIVGYHVLALASAVLGARLARGHAGQAYHWPQRIHWCFMGAMACIAVTVPFPITRWLAWPFGFLLLLNLWMWFARRRWYGLAFAVFWHFFACLVWYLTGWRAALPFFFSVHWVMLYEALYPKTQIFGPLVSAFKTSEKEVWLTIDDGPGGDTEAVLELLEKHHARATFFVIGERAEKHPEMIKAILAKGHQLGNHTHAHPTKWFWAYPWWSIAREVDQCQAVCERLSDGQLSTLFRSPVGFRSPMLHPVLDRRGLSLIGWTARGFDGVGSNVDKALTRLKRNVRPGAIVLLHQGRAMNVPLIEALLEWLAEEGFRCVVPKEFENESAEVS